MSFALTPTSDLEGQARVIHEVRSLVDAWRGFPPPPRRGSLSHDASAV